MSVNSTVTNPERPPSYNIFGKEIDLNNPMPNDFLPRYNEDTGFECSAEGFNKFAAQATEIALFAIPQINAVWTEMTPEIGYAMTSLWEGLKGGNDWVGWMAQAVIMILGIAEEDPEHAIATMLCDISGVYDVVVASVAQAYPGIKQRDYDERDYLLGRIKDFQKAYETGFTW